MYYKRRWSWLAGHNIPGIADLNDDELTLCLVKNCESYLKPCQFGYDYTNFAIPLTK